MFYFLETDISEQKKYEMATQTSVDNTVSDLRYEIKLWKLRYEKQRQKQLFY